MLSKPKRRERRKKEEKRRKGEEGGRKYVPRPQFLLLSLTVDVSRYANDNDQEYCYRGTAGDAGCLQHYTSPGSCKKNAALLVTRPERSFLSPTGPESEDKGEKNRSPMTLYAGTAMENGKKSGNKEVCWPVAGKNTTREHRTGYLRK